MSKCEKK